MIASSRRWSATRRRERRITALAPRDGGALPVGECVAILRDVARALAFAHAEGVVHRDIKADNILLSGGTTVATDFGSQT